MKKKLVLVVCMVMVSILVFVGCAQSTNEPAAVEETAATEESVEESVAVEEEGTQEQAVEAEGSAVSELKIGFSDMLVDEISTGLQNSFKEYWEANGNECVVLAADGNADEQLQTVEDLITQEVDVLVMRPISDDIVATAADKCEEAGVEFFVLDMAADMVPDNVSLNITFLNHYGYGVSQAEYLIELIEADPEFVANIGYIWHPNTVLAPAQARYQGLVDTLAPYIESGRANVLDEQSTEGDTATSAQFVENWMIRFPEMNSIVAGNDACALVACASVEASGKDFADFEILGIDGSEAAIESIANGQMDASVAIDFTAAILADCDVILEKLEGADLTGTVDTNLPSTCITIDNYTEYM